MPSHATWSRQVKEKAGFECQYCGTTDNLESHHIKPVCDYPDLQYDTLNGVCLCHHHHLAAHGGAYNRYKQRSNGGTIEHPACTLEEIELVSAFIKNIESKMERDKAK